MNRAAIIASSRLQPRLLQSVRLLIWLACLSLAQPFVAVAQTNAPVPLPPEAQEAFDKGIMAAREQGYILAIRYLQDARKIAPQAPQIFRSLGAVEAKIPGRELRAMAWYGAYLAALPNAPDAAEVKKEIARLEIKSQINISGLIQTLQDSPNKGKDQIKYVAELWADSGDIATALKTAPLAGEIYGGSAQKHIAAVQAKAGDIVGALKTAGIVERPDYRNDAFLGIAAIQLEQGDLAGTETTIALARRAADQISDGQNKWSGLKKIAELQIKAGRMDGAQATLRAALVAVDLIVIPTEPERKDTYLSSRAQGQIYIAATQIEAGDVAGAKQSLALAFKNSELIGDPDKRASWQGGIFNEYAKAGDVSNAIKTLKAHQQSVNLITDASRKQLFTNYDYEQSTLAEAQLKAGDISGALKTVNEINNVDIKSGVLVYISDAQVKAGDYQGAVKTNGEIADADKRSYRLYLIVKAQAEARDFDGAAKNADLIQVIQYKEWAVSAITKERAKANDPVVPTPAPTPKLAAKPSPVPVMTAADWIKLLDTLNTEPFLNLAGYLKSLPPSDNPQTVFKSLHETAMQIIQAQNIITGMLKQEAKK